MSGFFSSLKNLASGAAYAASSTSKYHELEVEDTKMRFSLSPQPGESGYIQWLDAMKMVARLQGGIPPEFRKRLWLTLAERHLEQRGVDWKQAERVCFNEWSNPDDEELGIQIVKDLHRTGCSLFCGAAGRDNQAVLRRVLLGFARWNKSVGYCQGLNVLAALVLQVMDRAESSAVKVMIYLIEGVLPEGYFADNLRGLSVDMAVFRDLLRSRLPKLSKHLEALQCDAKDKATEYSLGSSYEPPLTNVFTMQWFLTLFCHCLPQEAVLRVWDLIFLEGDEILLRTALAIWEGLSDRIMTVTSADEFYSIMGVLTREMLEFTDTNNLIKNIVRMGPLQGVTSLREKHRYNITPWARKLSDDEDSDTEEDERLAVAAAMFSMAQRLKKDRLPSTVGALQAMAPSSDRDRLALDITTLKQQYAKLRERQRQAHIILSAACARQSMVPPPTSQAMNHLLVGKSALVSGKSRPLTLPSSAASTKARPTVLHSPRAQIRKDKQGVTLHWKDTKKIKQKNVPAIDSPESGGASMQSPQDTSDSLSSPKHNGTDSDSDSTSTELCDEPERLSDVDSEEPTSTSDCYVMATDEEKGGKIESSSTSVAASVSSLTDARNSSEVKDSVERTEPSDKKNEVENTPYTEISIAKITDQIRRLSAEDDNSVTIQNFREHENRKQSDDSLSKSLGKNLEFLGKNEIDADVSLSKKLSVGSFDYLNYSSNLPETISAFTMHRVQEDSANVISETSTDTVTETVAKSVSLESTSPDVYPEFSSLSKKSFEKEAPDSKTMYLGSLDNRLKSPLDFQMDKTNENSCVLSDSISKISAEVERTFYSESYIGHLPTSPMHLEHKLSNLSYPLSLGTSTVIQAPVTTEETIEKFTFVKKPELTQAKVYPDMKSPKTPESAKSFSSGETMGPDSKNSSLMLSPRTLVRSDSKDVVLDKSVCSSTSSDSKTLVLLSTESNITRGSPRSDGKKLFYDKSNPSTPVSTDSLKNKSDASPKLVISSSSDSCSPSKLKSSERSFSSDLQSPVSANSIKYTSNYNKQGQENMFDSPMDLSAATSPFYPIVHPNQKTPSPYSVPRRRKSIDSTETSPEQKSVNLKESKLLSYQYKLDPSLQIVEASDSTVRKNNVYIRPQFTAKDGLSSSSTRENSEADLSTYGTGRDSYRKSMHLVEDTNDDQFDRDVLSQLPQERLDKHFHNLNFRHKDRSRLFERSSSSLERRFADLKSSFSSDEFGTTMVKKRSSDILEDIKHLEAKALSDVSSESGILTKKTSCMWEDLKNLEARRHDTFSNSARSFSKRRLEIPDISITNDCRKSYIVHPKINIDESSDSILKTVTQSKNSEDSDDGRESKLGVWTKVKPRRKGDNGRRSSDRALKIIQENSAILHKILACQAKKRLPDLEEISKEITISPINEEISKIFSPILEKMGLNEHEINEELARINFKEFDSVTTTSVSEFDAKINDELSKLSLIDDSEQVDHLSIDEMVSHEYLDTREALIDRKINEELSKLLANYEQDPSPNIAALERRSSSQNVSEIEGIDISSMPTSVFSYKTSSDFGSTQETIVSPEKLPTYVEKVLPYASPRYVHDLSPKSDIDIYRELEKLDKISSGQMLPHTILESRKKSNVSPISYTPTLSPYAEVSPSRRYSAKPEYDTSPYDYKSFDYKATLSPKTTSNNSYLASSSTYGNPVSSTLDYSDHKPLISDSYDLHLKSPILTKESLEFRVRYDDDESPRHSNRELSSLQNATLHGGIPYYDDEGNKPVTPTKYATVDETSEHTSSFLSYADNSEFYRRKYSPLSPREYSEGKRLDLDRQLCTLVEPQLESEIELRSYLPEKSRKYALSPSHQFTDERLPSAINHFGSELPSSSDGVKRQVSLVEHQERHGTAKHDVLSRGASCYKKSLLTLSDIASSNKTVDETFDSVSSSKTQFSPFPVRNATRKPKEIGLKLGLYSPKNADAGQRKS